MCNSKCVEGSSHASSHAEKHITMSADDEIVSCHYFVSRKYQILLMAVHKSWKKHKIEVLDLIYLQIVEKETEFFVQKIRYVKLER